MVCLLVAIDNTIQTFYDTPKYPKIDGALGPLAHWGWRKGALQKPRSDLQWERERFPSFLCLWPSGSITLSWGRTPQQHSRESSLHAVAIISQFPSTDLVDAAVSYLFQILYHHPQSPTQISSLLFLLKSQEYICLRAAQEAKRERKNIIHVV